MTRTASEQTAEAKETAAALPLIGLARLRESFPASEVGKLPRVTCRDCSNASSRVCSNHSKSKCSVCDNYMTGQHIHLDYVGHGAVTSRLLEVDPSWIWEPVAWDPQGLPLMERDRNGNPISLWMRLTVLGVTRLGVGTCPAGQFEAEKVLIGDALRNAAMRFGVAVDLWVKGHGEDDEKASASEVRSGPNRQTSAPPDPQAAPRAALAERIKALADGDRYQIKDWFDLQHIPRAPGEWTDDHLSLIESHLNAMEPATQTPPDETAAPSEPESAPDAASGQETPSDDLVCCGSDCDEPAVTITLEGEAFCAEHAPA